MATPDYFGEVVRKDVHWECAICKKHFMYSYNKLCNSEIKRDYTGEMPVKLDLEKLCRVWYQHICNDCRSVIVNVINNTLNHLKKTSCCRSTVTPQEAHAILGLEDRPHQMTFYENENVGIVGLGTGKTTACVIYAISKASKGCNVYYQLEKCNNRIYDKIESTIKDKINDLHLPRSTIYKIEIGSIGPEDVASGDVLVQDFDNLARHKTFK